MNGQGVTIQVSSPNTTLELNDVGQIVLRAKGLAAVLTHDVMDALIRLYDGGCCALCHRMVPGTTEPTICEECLRKEQARRQK